MVKKVKFDTDSRMRWNPESLLMHDKKQSRKAALKDVT